MPATAPPLDSRGLPASVDAEIVILGSILLDDRHYAEAASRIQEYHFSLDSHRRIYAAMRELHKRQQPIDIVTLTNELRRRVELESVGGVAYIASFTEGLPHKTSIGHWVDIVKDKATQREIYRIAEQAKEASLDGNDDANEILLNLNAQARDLLLDNQSTVTVESVKAFFERKYGSYDNYLRTDLLTGTIPTPWKRYNEKTGGGIQRKELTIIAARPSMGKSAWAVNMAIHAALRENKRVLLFSPEQSKEQVLDRAVCHMARVTLKEIRDPQGQLINSRYVEDALRDILNSNLFIDDSGGLTVEQIDARAEQQAAETGLDLIITDFLNYLDTSRLGSKGDNRALRLGLACVAIRNTGKRLNIGNILLTQQGRAEKGGSVRPPTLTDLKESGDIEQNADQVTFIHRPEYYAKEDTDAEDRGKADFIIAKQRNGPTETVRVYSKLEYFSFLDAA